jgi:hypothetical protein
MSFSITAAFVLLTASGHGLSQQKDDEQAIRQNVKAEVARAFAAGDVAKLERLSSTYRDTRSRTPSGLWKLTLFYSATHELIEKQIETQVVGSADAFATTGKAWLNAYPESPSAQLVRGQAMQVHAWAIRGHGYASSVRPEAWAAFENSIEEVRKYFETIKKTAGTDPGWYCEMASIAKAQHWSRAKFDSLLSDLLDRHPYYYQAVFCMSEYLSPNWYYENAGSIERFADQVVQKTAAQDGKSMYARIYWFMNSATSLDPQVVGDNFRIWPKMKAGFDDLIARYPDAWNLNHFALYACAASDKKKLAELMAKIGAHPLRSVWPGDTFEGCRTAAMRP